MSETGVHVWLILWKAYAAMREHAERHIQSLGLCLSDFAVLEVLLHKGPLLVNAIGARVRLTSGSITAAVDRLADKGLVARTSIAADRRARMVRLTAAGREFIERAFAGHEAVMERAAASLNPEERSECVRLLKRLGLSAAASAPSLPEPDCPAGQ